MPFNALLRITILQLLRSIGFDKAPPQAIDILTDVYIRHLQLLTSETLTLSRTRGSEEIEIQDITQALINLGMLQPTDLLDVYEQHENYNSSVSANYSMNNGNEALRREGYGGGGDSGERVPNVGGVKGAREFLLWVVGNVPDRARTVSRPTKEMVSGVGISVKGGGGSKPVIPEYMNALSGMGGDGEGGEAGVGQMQQQQQQQNTEVLEEDWLKYLMKKSSKLGTVDGKFKNTVLMDVQMKSDYRVVGPVVDELESKLPYNVKYEEDEDDDEYSTYVST